MYMNKFLFGTVMGMILGGVTMWYIKSSTKDKKKAYRTLKNIVS